MFSSIAARRPRRLPRSTGIIVTCLVYSIMVVHAAKSKEATLHRGFQSSIVCHVTMECISLGRDGGAQHIHQNHHFECSPVTNDTLSDFSYVIDLPKEIVAQYRSDIVGGNLFLKIPGGYISGDEVVIPENSLITTSSAPESSQRRQLTVVGTRSILVLRISATDTTPDYSAAEIYDFIFNETKPTLKSQYSKCSAGKLTFLPTQYGVMEVKVDLAATGASATTLRDAAITAVTNQLGITSITSLADHVMFCIPPGTGNWAGSAPVNHWRTVLNNKWCGYLSGVMHEIGHNLGLLVSVFSKCCLRRPMKLTANFIYGVGTGSTRMKEALCTGISQATCLPDSPIHFTPSSASTGPTIGSSDGTAIAKLASIRERASK